MAPVGFVHAIPARERPQTRALHGAADGNGPAVFRNYIMTPAILFVSSTRSAALHFLGLRGRIPPGAMMSLESVLCRQVEVSATDRSLLQSRPTERGGAGSRAGARVYVCMCVSECDQVHQKPSTPTISTQNRLD